MFRIFALILLFLPSQLQAKSIQDRVSFFIGSESPTIERYSGRSAVLSKNTDIFLRRASDSILVGSFIEINKRNYLAVGTTHLINKGFRGRVIIQGNEINAKFKEEEIQFGHYWMFKKNLFLTNTMTRTKFSTKLINLRSTEISYSYSIGLEYNITPKISFGSWFSPAPLSTATVQSNSVGFGIYYSI